MITINNAIHVFNNSNNKSTSALGDSTMDILRTSTTVLPLAEDCYGLQTLKSYPLVIICIPQLFNICIHMDRSCWIRGRMPIVYITIARGSPWEVPWRKYYVSVMHYLYVFVSTGERWTKVVDIQQGCIPVQVVRRHCGVN